MIITVQTDDVASVFGQFDGNVKKIEKEFGVRRNKNSWRKKKRRSCGIGYRTHKSLS